MTIKVSYKVVCPEDLNQPCKILLGSEAAQTQAREDAEEQVRRFNTRYYSSVVEEGIHDGVKGWLRVQELRRMAEAGIKFSLVTPDPFAIAHDPEELKRLYRSAANHLHTNLGMKGIQLLFRQQGSQGNVNPMMGLIVTFNNRSLPGKGMVDLAFTAFESRGDVAEFTKLASRNVTGVILHETVHLNQFFSYPGVADELERVNAAIVSAIKECNFDVSTLPNYFYQASPKEIEKGLAPLIEVIAKKDPEIVNQWKQGLNAKQLSKISFKKSLTFADLIDDAMIGGVILPWLRKHINLRTEGLFTSGQEALLSWQEFRDGKYRRLETEAYLAQNMLENAAGERTATTFDLTYRTIDDQVRRDVAFPFSKGYTDLESPKDPQLVQGLTLLINNKIAIYSLHGIDLAANLLFVVDVSNAVHSFQNFNDQPAKAVLDGSKAIVSVGSSVLGTLAILSNNPTSRLLARRIAGPAGAVLALEHSGEQLIDDFKRGSEVSTTEKALDIANTASNISLATGVGWGIVSAVCGIASGGTLIPVILIGAGIAGGIATDIARNEVQEERIAETLASALKQFSAVSNRSQDPYKATETIACLLGDDHRELDDDAFMDFFEIAENDPDLKEHLWTILAHPTLSPLRERIINQLISPDFFSYQRDEEGAYGMLIALHHQREHPEETKKLIQHVASRLDFFDWRAFNDLLKKYNLSLEQIDPNGWTKGYRPT